MERSVTAAPLLLGAHVSIAGGLHRAFERGAEIGATAIQIFTRNASRWQAKPLSTEEIAAFRAARQASPIGYLAAHDSYLINLASPDAQLRRKSCAAFGDELQRCAALGIGDLVMHPGAHLGDGAAAGLARLVESLREILGEAPPQVRILLENTAGQGSCLGARFEELAEVMERLPQGNFAVCFDSCHAFAAGYDLATAEGYTATMAEFDARIGLSRLALFHLNDSKKPLGSRVDRHEHVGKGEIGRGGFLRLMQDARFTAIPKIIETPGGENHAHDLENLALLRELAKDGRGSCGQ